MQNPSNTVIPYKFNGGEDERVDIYLLKGLHGRNVPVAPIDRVRTVGFVGSVLPKLGQISACSTNSVALVSDQLTPLDCI